MSEVSRGILLMPIPPEEDILGRAQFDSARSYAAARIDHLEREVAALRRLLTEARDDVLETLNTIHECAWEGPDSARYIAQHNLLCDIDAALGSPSEPPTQAK